MMRYPGATWMPVVNHSDNGIRTPTLGLILHVQEGYGEAGLLATFNNPAKQASAHFWVSKAGKIVQMVDTNDRAWAQASGNIDYLSVETEGFVAEPLTGQQINALATLYSWGMAQFDWPLALANKPGERGLGYHAMGGAAWGGHPCPGTIRIGQRSAILSVVKGEDDVTPEEIKAAVHSALVEFMREPALQSDEPGETLMSRDQAAYRTYSNVRKTMGKIPDKP